MPGIGIGKNTWDTSCFWRIPGLDTHTSHKSKSVDRKDERHAMKEADAPLTVALQTFVPHPGDVLHVATVAGDMGVYTLRAHTLLVLNEAEVQEVLSLVDGEERMT